MKKQKQIKYEFRGFYMSPCGNVQRSDVYAVLPDGSERYAFHHWLTLPHIGKIVAAAIYRAAGDVEKADKEAADHECYWMMGPDLGTERAVLDHCEGCGNFRAESHPYPPIDEKTGEDVPCFFPVALDYESAVKLFERDTLKLEGGRA